MIISSISPPFSSFGGGRRIGGRRDVAAMVCRRHPQNSIMVIRHLIKDKQRNPHSKESQICYTLKKIN